MKKKILYLTRSAEFGGMEKHILDLIKVVKNDFDIYVFSPEGPMVKEYINAGAKHFDVTPKNSFDLSYTKKVKTFVKDNDVSIVHAHELEVSVLGLMGFLGNRKVKKVMHVHTPITSWKHDLLGKLFKAPINWIFNFLVGNFIADKVIALTESIKKERLGKEWIFNSKIVVIPNAVDVSDLNISVGEKNRYNSEIRNRHNISQGAVVIGNIGRMTIEKGYDLLIKAFAKNFEGNKKYYLLLVGGGQLESEYKALVDNLGISSQVTITGKFKEEDKVKFYSALDYMVFSSRAEGFGYVLCEGMFMQIPILCSDLEVLKEVSSNLLAYFKSDSLSDLELKLADFVKSEVDVTGYSNAVMRYSMDSFKKNYLSFYKSLVL